jgi:hypothetical protein
MGPPPPVLREKDPPHEAQEHPPPCNQLITTQQPPPTILQQPLPNPRHKTHPTNIQAEVASGIDDGVHRPVARQIIVHHEAEMPATRVLPITGTQARPSRVRNTEVEQPEPRGDGELVNHSDQPLRRNPRRGTQSNHTKT